MKENHLRLYSFKQPRLYPLCSQENIPLMFLGIIFMTQNLRL